VAKDEGRRTKDDHTFAHAHGLFHDHGDEDDTPPTEAELSELYAYSGDSIELVSVGIDIGSSTSHLIFSRLELRRLGQNLSSRYVVVSRETIYRSPILLTPYTTEYSIDANRLAAFAQGAYEAAGFTRCSPRRTAPSTPPESTSTPARSS
jgi:ethanolamine utilization protein EutA